MAKVSTNGVHVTQLLPVPSPDGTTGLVAVAKNGGVYTWTGAGWLPLVMEVVTLPKEEVDEKI